MRIIGINSRANSSAFSMDSAYFLLTSLEVLDDERNFVRKADMFIKRTIKQRITITHVDTVQIARGGLFLRVGSEHAPDKSECQKNLFHTR